MVFSPAIVIGSLLIIAGAGCALMLAVVSARDEATVSRAVAFGIAVLALLSGVRLFWP